MAPVIENSGQTENLGQTEILTVADENVNNQKRITGKQSTFIQ